MGTGQRSQVFSVGLFLGSFLALMLPVFAAEGDATEADARLSPHGSTDRPYPVFEYPSREAWLGRANFLREHILVSTGLRPEPERTELNATIFGRIDREGYSVEKVHFESYPGFYVAGNLYRPTGKTVDVPVILNPHGHWENGRFADEELGSIAGRCINFALRGCIAFSYSMVGYNESGLQIKHDALTGPREQLWGIGPMGLGTWNTIRALDFVTSLAGVDLTRVGITGASGGGTQTFIASAIDERIKAAVPVNMISLTMQGGCVCENAPLLRLEANNAEIAGLTAPRPMLMISTSGDWTRETPEKEYPAVRRIYRLFGAEANVSNVHFDLPHNYNKDTREAVYPWFAKQFGLGEGAGAKEIAFKVEPVSELEVFKTLPEGAVSAEQLREYLIGQAKEALERRMPDSWKGLLGFRETFGPVYRHSIHGYVPGAAELVCRRIEEGTRGVRIALGRKDKGDRILALLLYPADRITAATLLADSRGLSRQADGLGARANSLAAALVERGHLVLVIHPFPAGEKVETPKGVGHFTTYNLTPAAEAVQDILTGAGYLQHTLGFEEIQLAGLGEAGVQVFLAAGLGAGVRSVAADMDGFENADDEAFVKRVYIPLLRRAGDFTTAGALFAPRPLTLFNTKGRFDRGAIDRIYKAAGADELLCIEADELSVEQIAERLGGRDISGRISF